MTRWDIRAGAELAGRVLLGLLFVAEAMSKLGGYGAAARYMSAFGLPLMLLPAAIALELGAGAMLIAGWHTRPAAFALAAFCTATAVIFHTAFGDRNQVLHFEKDLALAGAFLVVWARGAGRLSLDAGLSRQRGAGTIDPGARPSGEGGAPLPM